MNVAMLALNAERQWKVFEKYGQLPLYFEKKLWICEKIYEATEASPDPFVIKLLVIDARIPDSILANMPGKRFESVIDCNQHNPIMGNFLQVGSKNIAGCQIIADAEYDAECEVTVIMMEIE